MGSTRELSAPVTGGLRGLILYQAGPLLYLSRGYRLYRSRDGGRTVERAAHLPRSTVQEQLARTALGRRLVRGYIRHAVPAGSALVAFAGRRFFRLTAEARPKSPRAAADPAAPMTAAPAGPPDGGTASLGAASDAPAAADRLHVHRGAGRLQVQPGAFSVGKQPFHLAVVEGALFYGEYRPNPERSPVGVYKSVDGGLSFTLHAQFRGVRHIHGVFSDPWDPGSLLVATGDDDHESAIWRVSTEAPAAPERLVGGSQRFRSVTLVPTAHYIYFGSDTPRERNYIYRLDRGALTVERLAEVGGSVFWGRATPGGTVVFSTVVEPSEVNRTEHAELWVSPDGEQFSCAVRFPDDRLHPKLFQYAQIRFPAGPGGDALWITPYACRHHERSVALDLSEL